MGDLILGGGDYEEGAGASLLCCQFWIGRSALLMCGWGVGMVLS